MYFAYVIQSLDDASYYYKGLCEDLNKRLNQHNSGNTKSIKHKTSFHIVYYEEFENRELAIKRKKYFKTAVGRRFLKTKLIA